MGLTPDEFYGLSPAEFHYAMEDYNERQAMSLETIVKTMWETTRANVYFMMNMTPELKKKPKEVTDAFRLGWDKEEKGQSVEQMAQALKGIAKSTKKKPVKMKYRKTPKPTPNAAT